MGLKEIFLLFDVTRYIPKRHPKKEENVDFDFHPFCSKCGSEMIEKAVVEKRTNYNKYTGLQIEYHRKVWVCKKAWFEFMGYSSFYGHDYAYFGPLIEVEKK